MSEIETGRKPVTPAVLAAAEALSGEERAAAAVYLIAGSYVQAAHYARGRDLAPSDWHYVGRPSDLWGLHQPEARFLGTYYERRDIHEIIDALSTANANVQYEPTA